jgi:tRNA dimethylallyltransferase
MGPTASGKSALGVLLARAFDGEIVNADSRQFYREMNIGTAKPLVAERAGVAHYLIDCASIEKPWSVADFVVAAADCLQAIRARGHLPIVVGGAGMYLRALFDGLDQIPAVPDAVTAELRARFASEGLPALYAELKAGDPESAHRIGPHNTQRILRALAVWRTTGQPIHHFWRTGRPTSAVGPPSPLKIALDLPRVELYARIDARIDTMMARGLAAEARDLLAHYPENLLLRKTIGYAEWSQSVPADDGTTIVAIKMNSRRFAKRQLTWFRRETGVGFFPPSPPDDIEAAVGAYLKEI